MPLYSAVSPLLEANQWFRNGDHPDDRTINRINTGRVVKRHLYYKTPRGGSKCTFCGIPLDLHGMVGNTPVCPGDYIVTHFDGTGKVSGYSVENKDSFESKYELYKGSIPS